MRLLIFAIYDAKAEAYLRPFFAEAKGLAVRSFRDVVNEADHQMHKYAEDYTLFHIGSFDMLTGEVEGLIAPVSLGGGMVFRESL